MTTARVFVRRALAQSSTEDVQDHQDVLIRIGFILLVYAWLRCEISQIRHPAVVDVSCRHFSLLQIRRRKLLRAKITTGMTNLPWMVKKFVFPAGVLNKRCL